VRHSRFSHHFVLIGVLALLITACGSADGGDESTTTTGTSGSTRPTPTTTAPSEDGALVSPEFIQGAIPGELLVLLVGHAAPEAGPLTVRAQATNATVTVDPEIISGDEIAEVTVVPAPTVTESAMTITIDLVQGDQSYSWSRTVNVLPWEDDRGEQAEEILSLFTGWLAENRPELGVTPETELDGTLLAPELLVVSHYGFFGEEWELGLSWHVMLPPDDFSELYLRPRSELGPTMAFRIDSWQTALETGVAEVKEVAPPAEVVR
jgi:hypothetical protein